MDVGSPVPHGSLGHIHISLQLMSDKNQHLGEEPWGRRRERDPEDQPDKQWL